MNPSITNSTEVHVDHCGSTVCCDPRYFQASHIDWEWENPMILTHHSAACSTGDQEAAECKPSMLVDTLGSSLHPFNDMSQGSFPSSFPHHPWRMLNISGMRDVEEVMEAPPQIHHTLPTAFHKPDLETLGNFTFPAGNISVGENRLEEQRQFLGNLNDDAGGMHDFLRREIYSSLDLGGRVGLNLGGRTYFSEGDYNTLTSFGNHLRPYVPAAQAAPMCQAEGCKADLSIAKHYHRRHKVCEFHSKASNVIIGAQTQRFCQQCSRFHSLSEFDDGKRSCRKRLADHNRRRRKPKSHSSCSTNTNSAAQKRTTSCAAVGGAGVGVANRSNPSCDHQIEDIPAVSSVTHLPKEMQVDEKPLGCGNSTNSSPLYEQCLHQNGSAASSLSMSRSLTSQRQSSQQGHDLSVSWLGPIRTEVSPHDALDRKTSSFQILEKASSSYALPALPHVTQNLLQIQSRPHDNAITNAGWMMVRHQHEQEQTLHESLGCQNLNVPAQRDQPHSRNILRLLEVPEINGGRAQNRQHGEEPLEIIMEHHHPLSSTNLNDVPDCHSMIADEQGINYAELGLRAFSQSLYR